MLLTSQLGDRFDVLSSLCDHTPLKPLTGRGPIDAEDPEDLEDIGDHGGQSVGDIHLTVLESLGVRDKLVHLSGDLESLNLSETEERSEKRQPHVDERLELLQKHVQGRFGCYGITVIEVA